MGVGTMHPLKVHGATSESKKPRYRQATTELRQLYDSATTALRQLRQAWLGVVATSRRARSALRILMADGVVPWMAAITSFASTASAVDWKKLVRFLRRRTILVGGLCESLLSRNGVSLLVRQRPYQDGGGPGSRSTIDYSIAKTTLPGPDASIGTGAERHTPHPAQHPKPALSLPHWHGVSSCIRARSSSDLLPTIDRA
jgi:hypothetical protein